MGKKKTVIINYKARDTILEEAVNLLMRDSRLNKEVTKGKKLSWREIMEILEKKNIEKDFMKLLNKLLNQIKERKLENNSKVKLKLKEQKEKNLKYLLNYQNT